MDFDDLIQDVEAHSQSGELSKTISVNKTKYQSSSSHPDLLERIEPDGRVTIGLFKNGEFKFCDCTIIIKIREIIVTTGVSLMVTSHYIAQQQNRGYKRPLFSNKNRSSKCWHSKPMFRDFTIFNHLIRPAQLHRMQAVLGCTGKWNLF